MNSFVCIVIMEISGDGVDGLDSEAVEEVVKKHWEGEIDDIAFKVLAVIAVKGRYGIDE